MSSKPAGNTFPASLTVGNSITFFLPVPSPLTVTVNKGTDRFLKNISYTSHFAVISKMVYQSLVRFTKFLNFPSNPLVSRNCNYVDDKNIPPCQGMIVSVVHVRE